MEHQYQSVALVAVIFIVSAALILTRFMRASQDPREPPYVFPKIPYVGHIIGLHQYGTRYYASVNSIKKYPIFTLPMPAGKIYIVNSLELIAQVQRQPKVLSFWYLEASFGAKLAAVSKSASRKLLHNVHRDEGEDSLFDDSIKMLSKALRPRDNLDEMNQVMARTIIESLARFESHLDPEGKCNVDLWDWVKHEMTVATTDATYGPLNPYRDPTIESGFWHLSENVSLLILGIFPSLLARKGYHGRETVIQAFTKYETAGGPSQASMMTKEKYQISKSHGISPLDRARFETESGMAILSNTIPAAMWAFFHVFSRPEALSLVRERALTLTTLTQRKNQNGNQITVRIIPLLKLREDPILSSIIHETLRLQAYGAPSRMVMRDTMLNGYLLKQGSVLMMPNEAIHTDASISEKPLEFDARLFSPPSEGKEDGEGEKEVREELPKGAFRNFGGGANWCPGRFFAINEILFMLVLVALKYEIGPVAGEWCMPRLDVSEYVFYCDAATGEVPCFCKDEEGVGERDVGV